MAIILQFPAERSGDPRKVTGAAMSAGEIVLFTGIRYDRQDDVIAPTPPKSPRQKGNGGSKTRRKRA